jgi:hypothetical protein
MLARAFFSSAESFVVGMFVLNKGVKNHNTTIVINFFKNARDFLLVLICVLKFVKKLEYFVKKHLTLSKRFL